MSELIFQCEGRDQLGRDLGYRGVQRKEYYGGEYQIIPGGDVSVRIEKGLASAFSVIKLQSSSPLKFRRTWAHIRGDRTDLSVLWFVKNGRMALSQSGRKRVVDSGHCTISRSLHPLHMEFHAEGGSDLEVLHIIVPTHLVRSHIPDHVQSGATLSSHQGDCHLALRTFELLYEEGASVSQRAADGLAREAFSAVGASFAAEYDDRPRSLGDKRYEDVTAFIQHHLSNPDLSADMAARGVGISYGYLMHILKARGTSFSTMLWDSRIAYAKSWLATDGGRRQSISQIAYMAGFKSAAHFSRMFKNVTSVTPGEFRAN